jgi:hypothetical protein
MAGTMKGHREATARSQVTCFSCVPRKQTYTSRKAAKAAIRKTPGWGRMQAYPCPGGEGWHAGHLPRAVRQGEVGREIYRNPQPASRQRRANRYQEGATS